MFTRLVTSSRFALAAVLAIGASLTIGSSAQAAQGLLGVHIVQTGNGVMINSVIPGTSAATVGLQPGDLIVKVGTVDVYTVQDALFAKQIAPENTDVPFVIWTPNGPWYINARFGGGVVMYYAKSARPGSVGGNFRPTLPRPGGHPPRP